MQGLKFESGCESWDCFALLRRARNDGHMIILEVIARIPMDPTLYLGESMESGDEAISWNRGPVH